MPLPAFLTSSLFVVPTARSLPVIASVVLHASIGVGLVASAGGHARAASAPTAAVVELDVDALEAPVLAPVEPPAEVAETLPAHTHAYSVAPSHDAHPHDPSLHHDEAVAPVPVVAAAAAAVVAAASTEPAPALVADGTTLPRFSLASGSGAPMGVRVASGATGSGAGAGAGDETVHAASAVHAAARLVQSVTAVYPTHARADEVEGDVGVEIVVDREGRVVEARVTRRAGHGFDEAALAAVRGYRFSAAQREGRAVRVRMPWSVQFRLR